MPDTEEFTGAVHPWVVTHRNFSHSESGLLELLGHFHANDAAFGLQRDRIEDPPAEQAEVAIHIADRQTKCPPHRTPVDPSDDDTVPGVGTFDLVAVDEINTGSKYSQEVVNLSYVVLTITVGVKDQIFEGVLESRDEGRAIPEVAFVVDDAQERQL